MREGPEGEGARIRWTSLIFGLLGAGATVGAAGLGEAADAPGLDRFCGIVLLGSRAVQMGNGVRGRG